MPCQLISVLSTQAISVPCVVPNGDGDVSTCIELDLFMQGVTEEPRDIAYGFGEVIVCLNTFQLRGTLYKVDPNHLSLALLPETFLVISR